MLTPDLLRSFPDSEARSAANTIFVAADMIPMFDKHAGALRLFNLLRIMNELGWRTVFASALDLDPFEAAAGSLGDRERYERALRDIGVSEIAYGGAGSDRLLESVGSDLRWAFLSFPMVAKQLIPRVRLRAPQAKIIYDMVDFHAVRMEREARVKSDPAIQAAADRMRAIELVNARTADLAIAVSETDRRLLLGADPAFRIEIIPTIHDTPPLAVSDIGNRRGLFFVGGFLHAPNRDGIVWFAREVWPLIRGEVPDATLAIAGSNVPNEVLSLGSIPGVEIVGFVPDLTELFNRARVFVAPLRFGAGVSGKIGQSLARGLPVVTTRIGAEGMPLQDKEHALIADTPQDFAAAVVRLLRDDALWVRLQANGRALIERTQSIDHIRNIVGSLLSG
jgi:glycosyltransferase involved in cell wall biosynthesis